MGGVYASDDEGDPIIGVIPQIQAAISTYDSEGRLTFCLEEVLFRGRHDLCFQHSLTFKIHCGVGQGVLKLELQP